MVGKIKEGKSFAGCIGYNIDRERAKILYAEGIRTVNSTTITQDFNMQRKMNPHLKNAVGHVILSWSPHDKNRLNSEIMLKDAKDYMGKMNICNTQFIIVEHSDRNHPHLHIIYNRVNNEGRTISNNNLWKQNIQVTQSITKENGYYYALGKEEINRGRLKGKDKIKLEIFDAVNHALKTADTWQSLRFQLKIRGIALQYKFTKGTTEIQGVSFSKNDIVLKGSEVDRTLSYSKIDEILTRNAHQQQILSAQVENFQIVNKALPFESLLIETEKDIDIELSKDARGLITSFLSGFGNITPDQDDEKNKRKSKKLKRENNGRSI